MARTHERLRCRVLIVEEAEVLESETMRVDSWGMRTRADLADIRCVWPFRVFGASHWQ